MFVMVSWLISGWSNQARHRAIIVLIHTLVANMARSSGSVTPISMRTRRPYRSKLVARAAAISGSWSRPPVCRARKLFGLAFT